MEKSDQIIEMLKRLEDQAFRRLSPWFTKRQAGNYLQCSRRTIDRLTGSSSLKFHRLAEGGIRIHRRDLDSYVLFGREYNKLTGPQRKAVNHVKL